jgi:hypothetical protein
MLPRLYSSLLAFAVLSSAQNATFEGFPAVVIANSKLQITILTKGSTIAAVTLSDDPHKLNPLWNPMRMARELGLPQPTQVGAGQFICLDGFGSPSKEESAAGMPFHGEAHTEDFKVVTQRGNAAITVTMSASLPLVQETLTRRYQLLDGEQVLHVESELDSLLGFDRPISWAEHATIGSPFLEPGVTVVDISGSRSHTRPYSAVQAGDVERRLKSDQDFDWPMAPGLDGKSIDLRQTPEHPHYMDHVTTLLYPDREYSWATAINPKDGLLVGWVFRTADFPWLQYWGHYPATGKLARGMEFSTQPYDIPRRDAVAMSTMFGAPTYKWLPAKSKLTTRFLLFYAHVPGGFTKVDDVRFENGQLILIDREDHKQIMLISQQPL